MYSDNNGKFKLSIPQKTILIILGLIFSAALLEISLRLGGFIFSTLQDYRNRAAIYAKGTYRIICLGESTTALRGRDSYPSQLQEILNQRNTGIDFSVMNKGVVGVDTSTILSNLSGNLNQCVPNMVIAMMGINDKYILYYEDIPDAQTAVFKNFRTYRLARMIWMHIINKTKKIANYTAKENKEFAESQPDNFIAKLDGRFGNTPKSPAFDMIYSASTYLFQGKYAQAEAALKKAIELNPKSYDAYVGLGWVYRDQKKYNQAQEQFQKAIELNPIHYKAYVELGWIYRDQKKYAQAEAAFKKAIELNSRSDRAYMELCWIYRLQGKYNEAEEILQKGLKYIPRSDKIYGGLVGLYQEMGKPESARQYYDKINNLKSNYYTPATAQNYLRLKEILDKRGIKLVCVQYPMRSLEPLKRIFQGQDGVVFVDNETIFKEALARASYREYFNDMFGGDFGHCTRKGNRLLAENIANVILKERFGR